LVSATRVSERVTGSGFSYGEFLVMRASPGLAGAAALAGAASAEIEVGTAHADASLDLVDGAYFGLLGLQPARGRLITETDERAAAPVAVVSYDLWQTQFDGSPNVLGQTMKIHGTPFTVIGVLPQAYHGISVPGERDLAVPLSTAPLVGLPDFISARIPALLIVARLANVRLAAQTASAMDAIYQRCCAAGQLLPSGKGSPGKTRVALNDVSRGIVSPKFDFRAMFARVLILLMSAVAVVLLIVCANVGSLLLGRATSRRRELAVRLSLGASRGRLARQLLAESVLLAAAGAALCLALATSSMRLLANNLPGSFASLSDLVAFRLDGPVLGFTGVASLVAVLLFGTLPAWRATKTDLVSPLREGSRGRVRSSGGALERGIVIVQVALTLVLVSASGLLVATLRNLKNVDAGFATTHILSAWLDTRGTSLSAGGVGPLQEDLVARLRGIPGVRAVALSESSPMLGGRRALMDLDVPGYVPRADEDMETETNAVTPQFFAAIGIPVREGRAFTASDGTNAAAVAIVNRAFVNQYLAHRSPLGATIRLGGADARQVAIVGVAGDARFYDLRAPAPPMVYMPLTQAGHQEVTTLVLRTSGDPNAVGAALRAGIMAAAPGIQIRSVETMENAMSQSLARERLTAALASVFGALALTLALIGLYGIVSYNVARRTSEIGIRMALGARRSSVAWDVFRQSLSLVAAGVVIGLPLVFAAGRAIASQLWGVGSHDPLLLIGSVVLLAAAAGAASVLPAVRAASMDPLIALRAD
ncbi:MAG: ADOP family duplicated permease, partial [Gemmatimonadaceae bacterium]